MITNIRIKESIEVLEKLLSEEKNKKRRNRLYMIYLLKTRRVIDAKKLAEVMSVDKSTITRWLVLYRKGGLKNLLKLKTSPGRPSKIPYDVIEKLKLELGKSKGFNNIKEIILWLKENYNLECTYRQVHHLKKKLEGYCAKVTEKKNL
jgi:transposase